MVRISFPLPRSHGVFSKIPRDRSEPWYGMFCMRTHRCCTYRAGSVHSSCAPTVLPITETVRAVLGCISHANVWEVARPPKNWFGAHRIDNCPCSQHRALVHRLKTSDDCKNKNTQPWGIPNPHLPICRRSAQVFHTKMYRMHPCST